MGDQANELGRARNAPVRPSLLLGETSKRLVRPRLIDPQLPCVALRLPATRSPLGCSSMPIDRLPGRCADPVLSSRRGRHARRALRIEHAEILPRRAAYSAAGSSHSCADGIFAVCGSCRLQHSLRTSRWPDLPQARVKIYRADRTASSALHRYRRLTRCFASHGPVPLPHSLSAEWPLLDSPFLARHLQH